jgi:hypothetical protein
MGGAVAIGCFQLIVHFSLRGQGQAFLGYAGLAMSVYRLVNPCCSSTSHRIPTLATPESQEHKA